MNEDEFIEIGESYARPLAPPKPEPEEVPLVMYLVVRESLGMSIGKTATQVAHAAQRLQQKYQDVEDDISSSDFRAHPMPGDKELVDNYWLFNRWLKTAVRKVVLKADEKEWAKLKELPNHVLIVDAGFTELAPHTETVIGFWPMRKSDAPKIIKKLQVLK